MLSIIYNMAFDFGISKMVAVTMETAKKYEKCENALNLMKLNYKCWLLWKYAVCSPTTVASLANFWF